MSLKNGNAVAVERRVDLASLFCMIGRHGPAVALAVVAMVSVLAALVIYRTVRVKRSKATAKKPGEESRAEHEPSSADATDVSDEGSSDVKDTDLTQSARKIRLCRDAACSSNAERQVPSSGHATSHDTEVFKVDDQEDEATDKENNRQEEETENSPVHFDQIPYMTKNIEERPQGNEHSPETCSEDLGLEEPVMCYSNNEKLKGDKQHPDSIDYSKCSSNNQPGVKVSAPVHDGDEDDGVAPDVTEEDLHKGHLNKFTAVKLDTCCSQLDKQQVNVKQVDGLGYSQEGGVLPAVADQVKEEILRSDNIDTCGKMCGSSSVLPGSSLLCLSKSTEVDDHSLTGITTDSKAQISGIGEFKDGLHSQHEGKEATSLDEAFSLRILQSDLLSLKEEIQSGTNIVLAEGSADPQHHHLHNQQNGQMMSNDDFDTAGATAAPATYAFGQKPDENVTAYVITEDSCFNPPPPCQDQQSGQMETKEAFNKTVVDSAIVAAPCDNANITGTTMSEVSQSDMLPSFQEFSKVTSAVGHDLTGVINPPICKTNLLCFEQSELKDDTSSSGVGAESGISSMTVSPDLQDAGTEFVNTIVHPVMDFDSKPKKRSIFADNPAEDMAGVELSYQPDLSQIPLSEPSEWAKYESFAANEDIFGHEIDDGYHHSVDQIMAQIAAGVTNFTGELKKKTDKMGDVDGIEIREGSGVSVKKITEMGAEKEKEEDCEKTEISIMEATMDNNEWITDGNYQVLPWMKVSVPSFAQDYKKANQLSNEENRDSSSPRDADTTPSTEVKATHTVSLADENGKKVVAVQPMPQNVNVTFRIHYLTHSPYQTVAVTGNQQELGNWKGFIPLERGKDGLWATVVSLPAESHVEWKFVVLDKGEVCRWEECGNRLLDTGFGDDLLVHKWWGLL